jgi:nucleoprotein TPR
MAAMELDVPLLASFCSLPQTSIITLLDTPTAELVKSLLTNILVKAREFDEAKSRQLKLNVELENAIRGGEAKSRVLKVSIEKTQKEAADLREKVQQEGEILS